jgi:hypothetical protein
VSSDADPEPDTAPDPDSEPNPVRRALDFLVLAPVGLALTVAEELPAIIVGGRQRFETDVRNARIVGQFVVTRAQRDVVGRVSKLLHGESTDPAPASAAADTRSGSGSRSGAASASAHDSAAPTSPPPVEPVVPTPTPTPTPTPAADPADALVVDAALAGYDTLSASQVVRRLESLGPDELRAVYRHEASHRNRRTILNRAQQLLEGAGPDRPTG